MGNKFDLRELGKTFTVLDKDTNETCKIRVIEYSELKDVIGEFIGKDYTTLSHHLKEILTDFRGFVPSPYAITWYCVPADEVEADEFELSRAIIQARREGNSIVVVEVLPTDDVDKHIQMR